MKPVILIFGCAHAAEQRQFPGVQCLLKARNGCACHPTRERPARPKVSALHVVNTPRDTSAART